MRFIVSILLALTAIFGVDRDAEEFTPALSEAYVEEQTETAPETAPEPVEISDIDGFDRECSELMSVLSVWPDAEAVNKSYDRLYAAYCEMEAYSSETYLSYACDVTDQTRSELYDEAEILRSGCANELCLACRAVMEGPNAESFRAHVGEEAAAYFASYEEPDSDMTELLTEEQTLISEYYAAMEECEALCRSRNGQSWTMEALGSETGDAFYEEDPEGFFEIYNELLQDINNSLGPIFVELVALRQQIADREGYDSYADYAYAELYGRDYSTADAAAFCREICDSIGEEFFEYVYYEDFSVSQSFAGEQELIDTLGRYAGEIDPLVTEAWDYLTENGRYSIGDGYGRMESSFTLDVLPGEPFIFQTRSGTAYDLATSAHEFGHFIHGCTDPMENLLTQTGSYDLMEVHSNGLEVLYTAFYDRIFGEDGDTATRAVLADQLRNLVEGCIYDEFQRRVYAERDITLDRINRIYCDVCREFGMYEDSDVDYFWVYVSHNYDSPFYYISYAAGALASLQIWDVSRLDYDAAVGMWRSVVCADAYSGSYLAVLDECGMRSFVNQGAPAALARPALNFVEGAE